MTELTGEALERLDREVYPEDTVGGVSLRALVDAAKEAERLREAISEALGVAGNRWEEWGERAENVRVILDGSLLGEEARREDGPAHD